MDDMVLKDHCRDILIIDDDASVLESMSFFFEDAGYQVIGKSNGESAVTYLKENKVACVLTDLRMPGMSGLGVLEAVGQISPETPVIVISGADDISGVTESFHLGASDYLMKPIKDLSLLQRRVDDVLEKVELREKNKSYQESLEVLVNQRTAELRSVMDGLEDTIAERTSDLEKAMRRISRDERILSLNRMVAGVAHEVNTPLGVAMSAITYISNDMTSSGSADADPGNLETVLDRYNEAAGLVYRNLVKVDTLIRRFRGVAVSGSREEKQVINLREFIEMLARDMQSLLDDTSVVLKVDCPEDLVITSHPLSILQVLEELIRNSLAHAYSNDSGGILSLSVREDDALVVIEFSDDGAGMPPDILSRMFEPFFSTSGSHEHYGLGLSILWNTVTESLGGSLESDSIPGSGTRFILRFSAR